ncbi:T9SS type A sorting domain-containing protein [Lacibacter sediminis]|uniref:T9SS type A sorting domain-containing protein n=1 Tax=Lacibacter sediminis TaxID=2760713 RepID=A0A7G5XCE0_9BACT|nr:T9SS type A sorting domain-containing protein [Lacibacter sediminis]QNA43143.1 T9SS type A sorting domain-containing protein [Lacibacter sediminis]
MKKFFFSICFSFSLILLNAQATSVPYTGLLIASGTAGPAGDDVVSDANIPFTFSFYGTGYTTARISTNGFIWLSDAGSEGCCNGFSIPADPGITNAFIALTQTDWLPDGPANGTIFYAVTGTAPNRVFVVHYENIQHISSADRMTGEIQLYETTNEIRLVMSSLTGIAGGYTATMGIAAGDGVNGYAVGTRNQSASYSITNEAWSLVTPSSTLPVKLTGYDARKISASAVLEWSTEFEENNSHFAIERSATGRDFKQIAKINSKGNTTAGHQYNYTDVNPLNGKNYYRLVQYDLDGKSVYYGIKLVNFESVSQIKIMPNPIDDNFSISIQSLQTGDVQITVFDIHGRKVAALTKNVRTGTNIIPIISREWSSGFYTVKIDQDGMISTHKLVKK